MFWGGWSGTPRDLWVVSAMGQKVGLTPRVKVASWPCGGRSHVRFWVARRPWGCWEGGRWPGGLTATGSPVF